MCSENFFYKSPPKRSLKTNGIIKLELYKKKSDGIIEKVEPEVKKYNLFPVR